MPTEADLLRIEMAKCQGWRFFRIEPNIPVVYPYAPDEKDPEGATSMQPGDVIKNWLNMPNWVENISDMFLLEQQIPDDEKDHYANILSEIILTGQPAPAAKRMWSRKIRISSFWIYIHATTFQRSQAWLELMNSISQWRDFQEHSKN